MDFLAAMGTQIQCGEATLKVKLSPSAEDPRLRPSKVGRMPSEDTSPEVLEGGSTTVLGKQESDDKDTMYTEQSEVPAHNRIMRQMTHQENERTTTEETRSGGTTNREES